MEYVNEKLKVFEKNVKNKKIAIIGLGVSNVLLLDYFHNLGAIVTVFDNREKEKIPKDLMEKINKYEIGYFFGKDNLSNLYGFDYIFRSPSCMPTLPELKKAVSEGAILTTEIEMLLKLAPCKVIGITGTEGKTTTSSIIYSIIKEANINCFLGGNIGNPLFTKINEMRPDDIIVLEMSSFQLIGMEVSPDISIVTNIYPDHLNVHSSFEEYVDSKTNIFTHQNKDGIVILNYDNEITRNFFDKAKGKVIFFSSKEKLKDGYIYDSLDGNIKYSEGGIRRHLINKKDIKLRGVHNYENICAAIAATSSLVDIDIQVEAIKKFVGVEHRLEFVREIDGVKYYNDSIGTSPASTIAGLNAFDENIVLIAGGSDKGLDYEEVGKAIAENVGTLILCGPTSEKIEKATLSALENKKMDIYHVNNLSEQVKTAKKVAKKGDIVLLSPASASFDAFSSFAERGKKFKEIVNKL